ncbi:MAG: hypothetical protein JSV97_02115, partial [candidate division WOR-3 bacterium]
MNNLTQSTQAIHRLFIISFYMYIFSFAYGSYAINPWEVIENSDLIAECKFKGYIDTTCIGRFEIKRIYKGSHDIKQIAVYLYNYDEFSQGPIKATNQMLLVLKSRQYADLEVRMKFDKYHIKGLPLFIPAIQPASHMAIFNLDSLPAWGNVEMERLLWINKMIGLNKDQRRHELILSSRSPKEYIRSEAIRTLARDLDAEIQRISSIEDRTSLYASLLDTTSNRNVEFYALKFFAENYYTPAIDVIHKKLKQLPDSVCGMLTYYVELFKKYPDSVAAKILLERITNLDFLKYHYHRYARPNYRIIGLKEVADIGGLVNLTLGYRKDDIYADLYKEIVVNVQDSAYVTNIFPLILQLFKSYVKPQRTKLLIDLYNMTGKPEIFTVMSAGGEKSALSFLMKAIEDSTYDIYAVLSALGNYTDSEVGSLLVDIIQQSTKTSLQNRAIATLTNVLSHTSGNPSIKTVRFIREKLESMSDWDTRKTEVWKMLDLISASKSDTIVELIKNEIKKSSAKEKKQALTRKLDAKSSKKAFDFLYSLMLDRSEDIDVRVAALWQFAWYQDTLVQRAVVDIAISNDEDLKLRIDAIRILMDNQKKPSLAAMPLISVLETYTTWEQYKDLGMWTGFMSYLHNKDLTNEDLKKLDECLGDFYTQYMCEKSVTER